MASPVIWIVKLLNARSAVLTATEMTSVAADTLGERVGLLADTGDDIVAALEELFSQAWG